MNSFVLDKETVPVSQQLEDAADRFAFQIAKQKIARVYKARRAQAKLKQRIRVDHLKGLKARADGAYMRCAGEVKRLQRLLDQQACGLAAEVKQLEDQELDERNVIVNNWEEIQQASVAASLEEFYSEDSDLQNTQDSLILDSGNSGAEQDDAP